MTYSRPLGTATDFAFDGTGLVAPGPGSGDPDFESCKLFLDGSGTHGATVFKEKTSDRFITVTDATIDTSVKLYGTGSMKFTGSGAATALDSPDFALGSADFTMQFGVYFTGQPASWGGSYGIVPACQAAVSHAERSFQVFIDGTPLSSANVTAAVFSGMTKYECSAPAFGLLLNTWYLITFCRQGNTLRLYIDGVQRATCDVTGVTVNNSPHPLFVGGFNDATYRYRLNGNIDFFAFWPGVCKYPNGTTFSMPASGPQAYWGVVTGTVLDANGSGAERRLRAYRRDTGAMVAEGLSLASTGDYVLELPGPQEVSVLCLDDTAGATEQDLVRRAAPG
jgi:hypothetical protein